MRHPVVRIIGILLVFLAATLVLLQVALAMRSGDAFYGLNYKMQPLGIVYPIAALVLVGGLAAFVGLQKLVAAFQRRSARRDKN